MPGFRPQGQGLPLMPDDQGSGRYGSCRQGPSPAGGGPCALNKRALNRHALKGGNCALFQGGIACHNGPMNTLSASPRTTARARRQRVSAEVEAIYAILDQSLVAHVGFVQDGAPFVLPVNAWRVGDGLYFHFAQAGRFATQLRQGGEICATVSLLDGLVLARSAMHHSVNYRSVMLFGRAEEVLDPAAKNQLLLALVDKVRPGRAVRVRAPDDKELAATAVFRLPIEEGTAKVRQGPPQDHPDDLALPVWAGVIPLALTPGIPQPDDHVPDGVSLD